MNKIVVILVAVVIVAAAGVGAFTVLSNNGDDIDIPEVASGTGTVYGNSDGNCYIDKVDVAIAQSIIDGERSLKDFPFADANCDGKVDSTDVAMIEKMVNKEDMKVFVLDTQDKVVSVQYPVKKPIILAGSNLAPLITILGVEDIMKGAAYNTLDSVRDYAVMKGIEEGRITKISTAGTAADFDIISKMDVDVMLTEYSGMYDLDSDENIKKLNDLKIDVLCLECRDPGDDMRSLAVFGILMGKGDNVNRYMKFCDNIYADIKKIEGDKFGSKTVLISSLVASLSGKASGYTPMVAEAGGKNIADWTTSTKKVEVGSTWILDPKYASDCLLLGTSSNYGGTGFKASDVSSYQEKYKDHSAWTNGEVYIYSTSIPVVIRIAYFAQSMYSDIFPEDWANKWHQKFVDEFLDVKFDVDDKQFCYKLN